jgi:DNA processing protein
VTESEYLTAISAFAYFGPARSRLLVSYFKTAEKVWKCTSKELSEVGISEKKVMEFTDFRKNFDPKSYFEKLSKLNIKVTTIFDNDFPGSLKELNGGPVVLYYKGTLKGLNAGSVAIVGARKMTSYGREVTEEFSAGLSGFGVTIISGLARGVDTAAHKACLASGGVTIAVLGNGLDSVYPPENKNLAEIIVEKGGALISEYPLGSPALPVNFAVRNRIVSGLADCVLVIEGAEKSGTLLTASHAADQGKTVFAVPGQITSPLSKTPLFLLKNGAKIATEVKDVLDELDIEVKFDREKMQSVMPSVPEEVKFINLLENEPLHLDELVRISGSKTSEVSARLTIMEMKGMVRNIGGGVYKKLK